MSIVTPSLGEYFGGSPVSRADFVQQHVTENCALPKEFVTDAISREEDPLAKWFLVKASGLLRLRDAIPALIRICKEPEADFVDLKSTCGDAARSLGQIGLEALSPSSN